MPNFPVLVPIYFKVTGGTPAIDRNDPRMGDISFITREENLRISDAFGKHCKQLARRIETALADSPMPSRGG